MNVLLLSGGIESTCLAYWKRPHLCLTIDYGQPGAAAELEASSAITKKLSIDHEILFASAGRPFKYGEGRTSCASPEFWPYRNQFLATVALIHLFGKQAQSLWFGSVRSDAKFADGTREFFNKLSKLSVFQEGGISIEAPALRLSTQELIEKSRTPRSILGATFSCHRSNTACGDCPGCRKHRDILYSF
ncbi:7-cyano-7-deazaguanine synthase [Rhodopseudomonas palustris]